MASMKKVSQYAPDIYKMLNGVLLAYKPSRIIASDFTEDLREKITDSLNELEPRPLSKRLVLKEQDGEHLLVEVPNLADHPLVVGPRYVPWEIALHSVPPHLGFRSSGLALVLVGAANKILPTLKEIRMVNVYHVTGRFGYVTSNFWNDGYVHDKSTYKHINYRTVDSALSRIQSTQTHRLYESSKTPLDSQQAYELAKAWPSTPPEMAKWPLIYRLRCIHLKLPEFKFEITVINENSSFISELCHEIGLLCKSGAYCEAIRRVKFGPFSVNDSLLERDMDLQSIVNHLHDEKNRYDELRTHVREISKAYKVRTEYSPKQVKEYIEYAVE